MCLYCRQDPSHRARHRNATSYGGPRANKRHKLTRIEQARGHAALLDRIYDLGAYLDMQMLAGNAEASSADLAAYAWALAKVKRYYREETLR